MLLTIAIVYVLISVVFFGALAFAASQPMPAMEPADLCATRSFDATPCRRDQSKTVHAFDEVAA